MSRRHRAEPREVLPDPKFGDETLTKFMNYIMYEGKKSVAETIVYGAFDVVEEGHRRGDPRRPGECDLHDRGRPGRRHTTGPITTPR